MGWEMCNTSSSATVHQLEEWQAVAVAAQAARSEDTCQANKEMHVDGGSCPSQLAGCIMKSQLMEVAGLLTSAHCPRPYHRRHHHTRLLHSPCQGVGPCPRRQAGAGIALRASRSSLPCNQEQGRVATRSREEWHGTGRLSDLGPTAVILLACCC
jgi:hypothetical protein